MGLNAVAYKFNNVTCSEHTMTVKLRKYCLQIVHYESNAIVILSLLLFSFVIIFCFGPDRLFMYVGSFCVIYLYLETVY